MRFLAWSLSRHHFTKRDTGDAPLSKAALTFVSAHLVHSAAAPHPDLWNKKIIVKSVPLSVPPSGHIDRLINRAAGAVWRINRRGNRVCHAGQHMGKTDSSRSIKQRANNKCVRDGCATAINVKSIISRGGRSRITADLSRRDVMTENMLQPDDLMVIFPA